MQPETKVWTVTPPYLTATPVLSTPPSQALNFDAYPPFVGAYYKVRTIRDAANAIVKKTRTKHQAFAWGEEIIEVTEDPDGEALTTTTEYYTDELIQGSYGKVKLIKEWDGGWTRYEYYANGSLKKKITPFRNSGPTAPEEQCRVKEWQYTPNWRGQLRNRTND